MKRIWSGVILTMALSVPAMAADLTRPPYAKAPLVTKAPPMTSPAFSWSGFYVGAQAGYDWGHARVVDNGVVTEDAVPMKGAIGGLVAGVNWQAGIFVYGLEADFGTSHLVGRGVVVPPPDPPAPVFEPNHYKVDSSGSVRARAGLAVLPTTLIYATGGLALAKFEFSEHDGPTETTSVLTSWTAGGGIDQALTQNLIARVEYFYADYGSRN